MDNFGGGELERIVIVLVIERGCPKDEGWEDSRQRGIWGHLAIASMILCSEAPETRLRCFGCTALWAGYLKGGDGKKEEFEMKSITPSLSLVPEY